MTTANRARLNDFDADEPILVRLEQFVQKSKGQGDADQIKTLEQQTGLPAAAIRGALSFYDGLGDDKSTWLVCHGTACRMRGSESLQKEIEKTEHCRSIYCLGLCDRAPAALAPSRPASRSDHSATYHGHIGYRHNITTPPTTIRHTCPEPIVTRNLDHDEARQLDGARTLGVYEALNTAMAMSPQAVLERMVDSRELGRGGAAYPTGLKWKQCAQQRDPLKYVIANGDEGDPGSYIDRILLERDPHSLLEGMMICAYAVGATHGIVFIRHEYPAALQAIRRAIQEAEAAGILGDAQRPSGFQFHVSVLPAMGSYVCGESSAMLNALEGLRGEVRLQPPYPVQCGIDDHPTVVNNVETLVNVPWIMTHGSDAYTNLGTTATSGTKVMCLDNGFTHPCAVEVEFGTTLRQVIELGMGDASSEIEAVFLGGPMGTIVPCDEWDTPICYKAMAKRGITLGHGGMVALPVGYDRLKLLKHLLRFMANESCGKCAPCSNGSARALGACETEGESIDYTALHELLEAIAQTSLCAFGQFTPQPMLQLIRQIIDRDERSSGGSEGRRHE